jgi:cytochrome c6
MRPAGALAVAVILAALISSYAFAESGAETYKMHCSACHGARGAGDTLLGKNLNLRDLRSETVQKQSDTELAAIISKGKDRMPAYGRKLSREQIADVVKYIRMLKR